MTMTRLMLAADYTTRIQTLTTETTTTRKTHTNSDADRGPAVGALSMTPWRPPSDVQDPPGPPRDVPDDVNLSSCWPRPLGRT